MATTSHYYAGYVADDWKVGSRLTLNIGLRYGVDVPMTERYDRMNYFDPNVASPLAAKTGIPNLKGGLVFANLGGLGRRPMKTDRTAGIHVLASLIKQLPRLLSAAASAFFTDRLCAGLRKRRQHRL